ncbi:hypothetical protein AFLA70_191g002421 [Aspergillus flavus AF70]|nr:hypothetical protein AFLA70_191g002421 [Aspergillus flavus AF70]
MQFKLFVAPLLVALAMAAPSFEDGHLAKRTCGTLTGEKLKICQEACKAICSAGTAGIASGLCEKACDLGPLKREAAPEPEPSFGQKACDVACDVACNSTVLALEQRKCLEKCVSVIHQCSFPGFHSADWIPCYRRPSATTRFRGLHVILSLCDSESEEDELISLSLSGINVENVYVRRNDQ